MKSHFCVFVIFLILILSQNEVKSISNIGLVVNNLTRIWTNETCEAAGTNCTYSMNLCFSFSDALNCSIINIAPTSSWVVKPGKSKIIGSGGRVSQGVYNPVRVELKTWKAQKVVLKADIWRKDTPSVFIETLRLQGQLPYPIKDFGKFDEVQMTECGVYFCLNVWLYMWCDDIPGCVEPTISTTTMETHKTMIKPSKSLAGYATKTTHDHRTINTTTPGKGWSGWVSASTTTMSSCSSRSCGNITSGQDSAGGGELKKLVKHGWFWLCVVTVVLAAFCGGGCYV